MNATDEQDHQPNTCVGAWIYRIDSYLRPWDFFGVLLLELKIGRRTKFSREN